MVEATQTTGKYDATNLQTLVGKMVRLALEKGKDKAKRAFEAKLEVALKGGAGPAHKMTAVDHSLPPLRLIFEEKSETGKVFITDPIQVAAKHTIPWCSIWGAYDAKTQQVNAEFFKAMRKECLAEAIEYANSLDTSAGKVRSALKLFSGSTAAGGDHLHLRRLAQLPDAALEQMGMLFKQSVATMTIPIQELLNILCLLGKKAGGSRTIAPKLCPDHPRMGYVQRPFL